MSYTSFDAVRAVNPAKTQWRLRVRVIRKWPINNNNNNNRNPSAYEFILRDQEACCTYITFILLKHSSIII